MKKIESADAFVFIGTSFAVTITNICLQQAKTRQLPCFNYNVSKNLKAKTRLEVTTILGSVTTTLPNLLDHIKATSKMALPPSTETNRIDYQTLINSGIPISSINPRNLQLFARGKEVPIYIEGENDGVFHPTDFIEFSLEIVENAMVSLSLSRVCRKSSVSSIRRRNVVSCVVKRFGGIG